MHNVLVLILIFAPLNKFFLRESNRISTPPSPPQMSCVMLQYHVMYSNKIKTIITF